MIKTSGLEDQKATVDKIVLYPAVLEDIILSRLERPVKMVSLSGKLRSGSYVALVERYSFDSLICLSSKRPSLSLQFSLRFAKSDPDSDVRGWEMNNRGVSYTFGLDKVSEFLTKHDLDLICRAHQINQTIDE
ncbi:uncharacterized protein LOC126660401 isoform X2 [Mercurialis annua]|uniref:uncharacterized protein LOC126660401 isoform X2 n=1 Tax=Mercurialis annua TaxID=3986 RepID=UPI0024AEBE0C|nr:uncharacterized protein LOC126660401 isoform X2 [Mercurialis annua]